MKKHLLIITIFALALAVTGCGLFFGQSDITGVITNSETEDPVAGVTITIGKQTGTSKADGSYTIEGIRSGDYELKAVKSGFETYTKNVTLVSGEKLTHNFQMVPRVESEEYEEARDLLEATRNTATALGESLDAIDGEAIGEMLAAFFADFEGSYLFLVYAVDEFMSVFPGIFEEEPGIYEVEWDETEEEWDFTQVSDDVEGNQWIFQVQGENVGEKLFEYDITVSGEKEDEFLPQEEDPDLLLEVVITMLNAPDPADFPGWLDLSEFDYENTLYEGTVTVENISEEFEFPPDSPFDFELDLYFDIEAYDDLLNQTATLEGYLDAEMELIDSEDPDKGGTLIIDFYGYWEGPHLEVEGRFDFELSTSFEKDEDISITTIYQNLDSSGLAIWTEVGALEGVIAAEVHVYDYDDDTEGEEERIFCVWPVSLSLSGKVGILDPVEEASILSFPDQVVFDPEEWDIVFMGALDINLLNPGDIDFQAPPSQENDPHYRIALDGYLKLPEFEELQGQFVIDLMDWVENEAIDIDEIGGHPTLAEISFTAAWKEDELTGTMVVNYLEEGPELELMVTNAQGYRLDMFREFDESEGEFEVSGYVRNPTGGILAEIYEDEDGNIIVKWLDTEEEETLFGI